VRLAFLAVAAGAAVIAGVDVVETSFLLLVVGRT
jgi:hypothetical protein